jgi:hypothetical protein
VVDRSIDEKIAAPGVHGSQPEERWVFPAEVCTARSITVPHIREPNKNPTKVKVESVCLERYSPPTLDDVSNGQHFSGSRKNNTWKAEERIAHPVLEDTKPVVKGTLAAALS